MRPSFHPFGLAASVAAAAALVACLSGEVVDLGRNVDAGAATGDDASGTVDSATSGVPVPTPLISASISAATGTLCAGECVDLEATATGGSGPYAYSWGQGLGEGKGPKSVCPVATTTYSVVVSSLTSEQQSTASAMVTVAPCDGGTGPATSDSGAPPSEGDSGSPETASADLCVPNPSLEGTAMIGTSGPPGTPATGAPPQWQVCEGAPDVDPSVSLIPAADGSTYAGLAVGTGTFAYMTASIGTTLCAALVAGTRYSFCLDLGIGVRGVMSPLPTGTTASPSLQIWGGTTPCNEDALLWSSPPITNTDTWAKVCGSFVAPQALSTLTLLPAQASTAVPGTWSYVIVDDIAPGP